MFDYCQLYIKDLRLLFLSVLLQSSINENPLALERCCYHMRPGLSCEAEAGGGGDWKHRNLWCGQIAQRGIVQGLALRVTLCSRVSISEYRRLVSSPNLCHESVGTKTASKGCTTDLRKWLQMAETLSEFSRFTPFHIGAEIPRLRPSDCSTLLDRILSHPRLSSSACPSA